MNEPSGKVKIKSGKEQVFFSQKQVGRSEAALVDEYTMTCEKSVEQNYIYVIFSPNEFTKANDRKAEEGELVLPRELSFEEFQKWLAKNRTKDKNMKVVEKGVTINK
jgi:hypothetical protein